MNAGDVMTRNVVTVSPDTTVAELVNLLLTRNISGVPVVDADGTLVGVVTEGDLVRRSELGTERKRGGWLAFFTATATMAQEYVRSHGSKVRDLMTPGVVAVSRDTSLLDIADLMEERHVRRVPVVEDGKVVGIVSRANLLRAWASLPTETATVSADDAAIRNALLNELAHQAWSRRPENSVVVTDGIVHLWGLAATDEEKRALELAAEQTQGCKGVRNHVVVLAAEPYPLLLGA
jgi:CBS domain-containing protein